MMTKQRRLRLRQKIQASRGRLMASHPFFGLLLMYLKYVAVSDMKKMSTNGRCIYFSPDFVDKLYDHELDYILCHQIMHIIYGHIWRPYDREGDDYHFACDIQINTLLTRCGFIEDRYAHLGNVYRKVPSKDNAPIEMTSEEIFISLPYSLYVFDERTRSKFLIDSDLWWNEKDDIGNFGEIVIDLPELDGMLRESKDELGGCSAEDGDSEETDGGSEETEGDLKQEWQGRAASAASGVASMGDNSKGYDDVPDFVKRMIDKMKEPTIDWKKILNNFVQERICDYSFAPPDRRFSDFEFFLPDFNEKDFVSKEVLFMVDTSGSVEDEDLAIVYSEIRGAIEQFGGKLTGKLGFFDADVTPPLPFENVGDLMNIIPYGGGGTDFTVIFDYIRNNCKDELPACIVIFTDGDGPYPSESEAMGIPVLWIINNFDITPPWGKTTRIIPVSAG